FSLAEDTDDLFVGKTLLHGDVLMWLMKTLLTSVCINQRGAGQKRQEGRQGCETASYHQRNFLQKIAIWLMRISS
ncbi:hypothetical protein, partial [Serratia surfactantfaciens]|uniref:hypothetical protein n=1 Tax=Serratia surfactantfaciens TaxID=2741499 RepID=UPI003EDE7A54